ncbi:MAG: YraN family protein [Deltaproteobacteria bacterium]|nr:MAG: YraN family protein [Deltaproteobacteria bacterium]
MRDDRRALGAEGEARAAAHLERRGYRVIDRNVRAGGVELDLVATRARLVVFVEVKTRRGRRHGPAEDAVDALKRARLVRGAAAWLRSHDVRPSRVRFDVIAVEARPNGEFALRHLEGAFDAGG